MRHLSYLAALLLVTSQAQADVVFMKNGDRITGTVSQIEDGRIRITPAYGSGFTIRLDQVESIETAEAFEIELQAGRIGSYQFAGTDPEIAELIVLEPLTEVTGYTGRRVPLSEIKAATHPREFFEWRSRLDMTQSFSSGNVDSRATNINGNLTMRMGDHRTFYNLRMARESVNNNRVKNADALEFTYSWLVSGPWFIGGNAAYDQNEFARIDERISLNPAIGYDFWDSPTRSFNIQAGPGYQVEKLNGTTYDSGIVDWRLRISQSLLTGSLELYHRHRVFQALGGRENLIFDSSTGLRVAVTRDIYLNMEVQHNIDNQPVLGTSQDNTRLLFGAGFSFN